MGNLFIFSDRPDGADKKLKTIKTSRRFKALYRQNRLEITFNFVKYISSNKSSQA